MPIKPHPAPARAGPDVSPPMAVVHANTPPGWISERPTINARRLTTIKTLNLNQQSITMPLIKSKPRPDSDSASSPTDLGARIIHYVQAGYPGLYLVSPEEQRVEAELKSVTGQLNRDRKANEQYQLCYWSVVDGLVNMKTNQVHNASDPLEMLQIMGEQPERTIVLLKDFHLFLQDANPILVR